jgi:monofunctional biosynthetic peptidoglycan transglycosylase
MSAPPDKRQNRPRRRRMGIVKRLAIGFIAIFVALPVVLIGLYGIVPPPVTPLMVIRLFQGEGLTWDWVSLEAMSPDLPAAVIAAEDNNFCRHEGFDWEQIEKALETYEDGGRLRGASTIPQQTAKNLFLWPDRSFVRKGLEAYLTVLLEFLWSKKRILETYLNVVEWSGGVYGAEAAAQHYFGKPAADLTQREAALLATVLPNPRERSASNPTGGQQSTADTLLHRIGQIRPLLDCY